MSVSQVGLWEHKVHRGIRFWQFTIQVFSAVWHDIKTSWPPGGHQRAARGGKQEGGGEVWSRERLGNQSDSHATHPHTAPIGTEPRALGWEGGFVRNPLECLRVKVSKERQKDLLWINSCAFHLFSVWANLNSGRLPAHTCFCAVKSSEKATWGFVIQFHVPN